MWRSARTRLLGVLAGVSLASAALTGCSDGEDPTPSDAATPIVDFSNGEEVPAGRYAIEFEGADSEAPVAHVEVPEGFAAWDGSILWSTGDGSGPGLEFWTVYDLAPDPCEAFAANYVDPGPSVEDLAAALMAQKGRVGLDPEPVTFAGYNGLYLEFSIPTDLDPEKCLGGTYDMWRSTEYRFHHPPGALDRIWILEVEGDRLLVNTMHVPGESLPLEAELEAMLDSITIGD